ncbi:MAG TPA: hypothetical protein VGR16_01345, partial [Thermomicrobiales bacterium]|nr:hypothetical protein [Thermomicrobiales bacterium]
MGDVTDVRLNTFRLPTGPMPTEPTTVSHADWNEGSPAMPAPGTPAEQRVLSEAATTVTDP